MLIKSVVLLMAPTPCLCWGRGFAFTLEGAVNHKLGLVWHPSPHHWAPSSKCRRGGAAFPLPSWGAGSSHPPALQQLPGGSASLQLGTPVRWGPGEGSSSSCCSSLSCSGQEH